MLGNLAILGVCGTVLYHHYPLFMNVILFVFFSSLKKSITNKQLLNGPLSHGGHFVPRD